MAFLFRTAQWVVLFPLWQMLFPNNPTSQFLATSGTALTWLFVGTMLGEEAPRQTTTPVQAFASSPTVVSALATPEVIATNASPELAATEPTENPISKPTATATLVPRPTATTAPPSATPTAEPTPPPLEPTASPTVATPATFDPRPYLGQGDRYNCGHFVSQADAQTVLRSDPSDPNRLDGNDRDGIACETNPAPYDRVPVTRP
jgi:hypothetical protein